MDVYNQFILSKFNESVLNQIAAAETSRSGSAQPSVESDASATDIDAIAEKSKTATMHEIPNDNCDQTNQQNSENHLTNNVLHEINRQFLSALLQKGFAKSTTEHCKQNAHLNPLTPPQTPITPSSEPTIGPWIRPRNASNASSASQSMAANSSEFNENCPAIDVTGNSSNRKRKRPTANRPNKRCVQSSGRGFGTTSADVFSAEAAAGAYGNLDVSSTDETDPDNESDGDDDGDGDGNGDRSDISTDTEEHEEKFGENETSFDSVSTTPAGANSLLFNSSSSKAPVGGGLNLVADKDKLNLLKLISLQSDENKLIGKSKID